MVTKKDVIGSLHNLEAEVHYLFLAKTLTKDNYRKAIKAIHRILDLIKDG